MLQELADAAEFHWARLSEAGGDRLEDFEETEGVDGDEELPVQREVFMVQLEELSASMQEWGLMVRGLIREKWERRNEIANAMASDLNEIVNMLKGSTRAVSRRSTELTSSLSQSCTNLEGVFREEEDLLRSDSILDAFPQQLLRPTLQRAREWMICCLVLLNPMLEVSALADDVSSMRNLEVPALVFEERRVLKEQMVTLEDDLDDQRTLIKKEERRGRAPPDEARQKLAAIKEELYHNLRRLREVDGNLCGLVAHYPEYKNMLLHQLVSSQLELPQDLQLPHAQLIESCSKLSMFDISRHLSKAGQLGARHSVYLARQGSSTVVLKEYVISDRRSEFAHFLKEAALLRRLEHPFLVRLLGIFIEDEHGHERLPELRGYLKMPYYEGGTLLDWCQTAQPSDQQKHRVLLQVLQGLEHLRQNNIVHCDIKPANILLSSPGSEAVPCIADFDVSRKQEERVSEIFTTVSMATSFDKPVGGTLLYSAPEIRRSSSLEEAKRSISHKCDMYSYGVVMLQFIAGLNPQLEEDDVTADAMRQVEDPDARDLICSLRHQDSASRPSSAQALAHPYFTSSMIIEREQLEEERRQMQSLHDRKLAELTSRQLELADQQAKCAEEKERNELETRRMLERKQELELKGRELDSEEQAIKRRLEEEERLLNSQKAAIRNHEQALQRNELNLNMQLRRLESDKRQFEQESQEVKKDRAIFNPPLYWKVATSATVRKGRLDVTREWKGRIEEVLNFTSSQSFQVHRVFQLEQRDMWESFALQRKRITQSIIESRQPRPRTSVKTDRPWMDSLLQRDTESNEVFLFHGTKANFVDSIVDGGLDERVGNLNGMFGAGIYFAEDASKSAGFCSPNHQGLRSMFLVRVVLGCPLVSPGGVSGMRRPPPDPVSGRLFDSVIGCPRLREFIVYDRNQ
eukprot:481512-Hanusia_phi.AAC.1